MRRFWVGLAALGAACGDGPTDPPGGNAGALVIAPGALLFAEAGATQRLRAYAVDGDGDSTEVTATYASSDPSIVSVSGDGLATAGSALGSAQIVATSGDLTSAPILVLRATPAAGALLIADSQVVGTIAPVDPAAAYAPGWRYRVRLRNAIVQVGQVVLASGGAPIGGRVISVSPAGTESEVVLELMALNEMFVELSISQRLSLEQAELGLSSALGSSFRIGRQAGGGIHLTPKDDRLELTASAARPSANASRIDQEFELGPFTCKAEVPQLLTFPLSLDVFSMELDPSLALDLVIEDATLERMVVEGGIAPRISASPRITAALEAKAECKVQVATLILPIGGPLALIVGGQVPLGVGFEAGAKASFGNLGFDAFLTTSVDAAFGIDCAAGCGVVAAVDQQSPDGYFKPVVPDLGSTLRFELGASAFGWAELKIGNQFLQALQFKAVEMKAGLEQKFELAAPEVQAADPAYASSYSLKPVIEAKAAASLAPLEDLLRISIASLSYAPELPAIAESPRGTFAITPASVAAGDGTQLGEQATFTITLPAASYLGAYAIEGVQIRWHRSAGESVVLEPGRPGCTDLEAAQDQLTFTCQTDFLEEHAGAQTFYAFLETRIFGVPVPVPLEVAADGKATVTVTGGAISVTPSTVSLAPGQTQEFIATVAGGGSQAVTWSATGGTFTASGNTLQYTAGAEAGSYAVTATSAANPTLSASAAVTIADPPVPPGAASVRTTAMARTFDSPLCEQLDQFMPASLVLSRQSPTMTCTSGAVPTTATSQNAFAISEPSPGRLRIAASGRGTLSGGAVGDHYTQIVVGFTVTELSAFSVSGSIEASIAAQTRFGLPEVIDVLVTIEQTPGGVVQSAHTFVRLQNGAQPASVTVQKSGTLPPGTYALVALIQSKEVNSVGEFDIILDVGP